MPTALIKTYAKLEPQKWDRKPIRMAGIYKGIPLDKYHSADICFEPSISSSGLRKLYNPSPWVTASPAHYWCESPYNPDRLEEDEKQTRAMILGRAAHHLLFGEAKFYETFAVRPMTINGEACNRITRQGKIWHKKKESAGLTVVTIDQMKAIRGIAYQLEKDPLIIDPEGKRSGILNGEIECSWFWKHPSGIWLKIRPDCSPNDSLDYVDLKLTHSIMWPDLQRTIREYGYFMQAGLTAMGVRAITGQHLNSFTLVFAETSPPHCIEIVTLKDEDIKRGIDACEIAIAKFNKCWKENRWPGPRGDREDAQFIEMSENDQKRIDETIALDKK